jgi:hypothetical protein
MPPLTRKQHARMIARLRMLTDQMRREPDTKIFFLLEKKWQRCFDAMKRHDPPGIW